MSFRNFLALAASACLLFTTAAQAEKTAGEHVDDSTIATATKAELIDSDKVSANHINVEVYQGHVQLAGFVESEAEAQAAIKAAHKVGGVVKVHDGMVVLKGHRSLGQTLDDTTIQTELKTKLANVEGVEKALAINTEVRQGHVLLSGWVSAEKYRAEAGKIAGSIGGVKQVHNKIALKP
jgi:hyperosmotically inducible protein